MTRSLHTRRLHADLDTPVSAYLKLRGDTRWSFLFESVEGSEVWATYSILGIGARRVFVHRGGRLECQNGSGEVVSILEVADPLTALRQAVADNGGPAERPPDAPRFVGGAFGFLAYDAVRAFEPIGALRYSAEVPDAIFVEPEVLAVFDNRAHSLSLYADDVAAIDAAEVRLRTTLPAHPVAPSVCEPRAITGAASFEATVRRAKEEICAGEIIQVVLSRRFELPRLAEAFDVYRGLRTINPSPYLYFMHTPQLEIAGASPEVMIRIREGEVTVRPIAGTRPRGRTAQEDARLADELLADPKECAEHIMLVDLGRNDVGRVSQPGAVSVPTLMVVERYSHVMHIVSEVRGRLREDCNAYDALRAAFPAGTLSGAPKIRAMQIIDELEDTPRGIYGGAVGYFGPDGDADFGIAIRTLVAYPDKMVVQAGAGIVADSDPRRECEETEHKAQAVFRAAQWAASKEASW